MDDWGTPLEYEAGSGVNYCTYDGITFNFDADGTIFTIDLAPSKCVINTETLGKSHDTLLDILGAPTEEGWVPGGYTDVYHMLYENWGNGVEFSIEFITLDETASNMRIWQN